MPTTALRHPLLAQKEKASLAFLVSYPAVKSKLRRLRRNRKPLCEFAEFQKRALREGYYNWKRKVWVSPRRLFKAC